MRHAVGAGVLVLLVLAVVVPLFVGYVLPALIRGVFSVIRW